MRIPIRFQREAAKRRQPPAVRCVVKRHVTFELNKQLSYPKDKDWDEVTEDGIRVHDQLTEEEVFPDDYEVVLVPSGWIYPEEHPVYDIFRRCQHLTSRKRGIAQIFF